jgi:ABC-type glycerol-3-phosphate transport system substrate-binding protein
MHWVLPRVIVAVLFTIAPLGARAADLVVWWEKGRYDQEDRAVREIVAAFEQETGKRVNLAFYEEEDLAAKTVAALKVDQPPDFDFGLGLLFHIDEWAYDDQLADLEGPLSQVRGLFDADAIEPPTRVEQPFGAGRL